LKYFFLFVMYWRGDNKQEWRGDTFYTVYLRGDNKQVPKIIFKSKSKITFLFFSDSFIIQLVWRYLKQNISGR